MDAEPRQFLVDMLPRHGSPSTHFELCNYQDIIVEVVLDTTGLIDFQISMRAIEVKTASRPTQRREQVLEVA